MRHDERGSIVVTALLVGLVLSIVGAGMMRTALADLGETDRSRATDMALQAAEAGVNDYIAKLTEDHLYYDHWVHRAESTRNPAAGPLRPDGTRQWSGDTTWTYPNGRDGGVDLGDGFSFSLQIFPPTAAQTAVRVESTGWRTGDPATAKTVQALVRAASIADFQMISNANIKYGDTAVTKGKVYSAGTLTHEGQAHANLYAEGSIVGKTPAPVQYFDEAKGYAADTIRSVLPSAIDFTNFTDSLGEVRRAAEADGVFREATTAVDGAEWLDFRPDGSVEVRACTEVDLTGVGQVPLVDGRYPRKEPPPCTPVTTLQVPRNGAIYVDGDVVVSGTVRGRVTVASPSNVVIGDDLRYATPGVDVIGLMAKTDVMVPAWAPADLEWWSATLAIENKWRSPQGFVKDEASHDVIRFHGSTATFLGGGMNQYRERFYEYDENLLFLQPPYFPMLEDAYTIELFREIP